MPKDYRKPTLSFQAGEISPQFYGRSDTDFYQKGLAEATNVVVDKRGGVRRRNGLEHELQIDGNDARIFVKQIHRYRFDVFIFVDQLVYVFAPGAGFQSPNLVSNPTFNEGGTDWSEIEIPASSSVIFADNVCHLEPEQNNPELIENGNFDNLGTGWSETTGGQGSSIVFTPGLATLTAGSGGGTRFARIYQASTTTSVGEEHTIVVNGSSTGAPMSLKVGTGEDDGSYLDVTVSDFPASFTFTPPVPSFITTIGTSANGSVVTVDSVSIEDEITKIAGIGQELTITAAQTDSHTVSIRQTETAILNIKIGTSLGDDSIASVVAADDEIQFEFVPNNPTVWITVESDGAVSVGSTLVFVGVVTTVDFDPGETVTFPSPFTNEQLQTIHVIEEPTGEKTYFTHPNVPPQEIAYSFPADVYTPIGPIAFVAPPAVWTATNWPATGTFFQGRLWLGGTPNQPQTFWGSVSGSPEDFTVTPGNDSSSLEFTLQIFGRIKWMLGTKNLIIGTENGEHVVDSEGPVVTPSDFKIQQQSSYGSNSTQAIQIGEKVFYTTPDGRRLRAMAYEWQEDNWLSQDLSFASNHLLAGRVLRRTWAQNPNSLFVMSMGDGNIVVLTYDRTGETVGWTRVFYEGSNILDVGVGSINGDSRLVIANKRTANKVDIEAEGDYVAYMDSYITTFSPLATNVLTGLDHLEGQLVQVIVDGAVEPSKVVEGGQITTERAGNRLAAGIKIESKVVTLAPDVPNQLESIRSFKKRWNKVWALLYDSNIPIINGVRPPDRTPATPMDTPEQPTSGHFKTVNLGWDDFGQITIEENLPVPMFLLTIYGEVGAETL